MKRRLLKKMRMNNHETTKVVATDVIAGGSVATSALLNNLSFDAICEDMIITSFANTTLNNAGTAQVLQQQSVVLEEKANSALTAEKPQIQFQSDVFDEKLEEPEATPSAAG